MNYGIWDGLLEGWKGLKSSYYFTLWPIPKDLTRLKANLTVIFLKLLT